MAASFWKSSPIPAAGFPIAAAKLPFPTQSAPSPRPTFPASAPAAGARRRLIDPSPNPLLALRLFRPYTGFRQI
ncbi:MAG: hypothetical protein LBR53_13175 [Deltaproteobacteria bacterium]|nr:hypothetical protein [Deltaproteobacteria bacterium]